MKSRYLLIIVAAVLFGLAGCNENDYLGEEPDVNLKSAGLKMLPVSWDWDVVLTQFKFINGHPTPVGGPVYGTISHLGELQEGSFWKAYRYIRNDDIFPSTVDYGITGKLVADNGDELYFTTEGYIYHLGPVEGKWEGYMYFTGGTGRFENVVGEGESFGWLTRDENGIPYSVAMHLDGMISSVGSSKK
ncbi:MAG: hypothetical protein ACOZDD_15210 [Bacteroidota bacterium]